MIEIFKPRCKRENGKKMPEKKRITTYQEWEAERFRSDVNAVVEKICSALHSVCSVMQAQAGAVDELIDQSKVSYEAELNLSLAKDAISNISIDVSKISCRLEGHKLVPDKAKSRGYRNTYRCERCQLLFGLDGDNKLKWLY